ncbi:MAG: radical SAM protein [Pseudonocardiaceae bacterium]
MTGGCGGATGCATGCGTRTPAGPVLVQLTARPAPSGPAPWFHLVAAEPPLVLLVERSALFEVDPALFEALAAHDPAAVAELAAATRGPGSVALQELGPLPAPRAISLNVAQSCNLACSYCYADEGRFGGSARRMSQAVARRAVDGLLAGASPGDRVLVGFIGGEPMLNRAVVHDAVAYATTHATSRSVSVGFSITTNGTLLQPADIDLFRTYRFTVTASVDGGAATHDRHRRGRHGEGSWRRAIERLRPLLEQPGQCRLSARSTVTRDDLDIAARVQDLAAVGFREVGVSPARTGPDPALLLEGSDWARYLEGVITAAEAELIRLRGQGASRGWLLSNLGTALGEIHRGTARPLPCGAAYGYVSVDVDGAYATCHRTVGDPRFRVGAPGALDDDARRRFLTPRLVDRQEPCRSCWARYLCGGGCHAEVSQSGRENCDMIRGWLDYCLGQYPIIRAEFPELFAPIPEEVAAS